MAKSSHGRGSGFRRPSRSRKRLPQPLVFVACEGKETERRYLDDLCRRLRFGGGRDRVRIESFGRSGGDLVVKALRKLGAVERENGLCYDELWLVFDVDDRCLNGELAPLFRAAGPRKGGLTTYSAHSNPCVEPFFLLHFEDRPGALSPDEARARLLRHVPDYRKSAPPCERLWPRREHACRRAAALGEFHRRSGADPRSNPSTTLGVLVERLHELAQEKLGPGPAA